MNAHGWGNYAVVLKASPIVIAAFLMKGDAERFAAEGHYADGDLCVVELVDAIELNADLP